MDINGLRVKYLSQYNPNDLCNVLNDFIRDKNLVNITFAEKDHWYGAFVQYIDVNY